MIQKVLQAPNLDVAESIKLYVESQANGTKHVRVRQEDHWSLTQERCSNYIGHINPLSGKAVEIAT